MGLARPMPTRSACTLTETARLHTYRFPLVRTTLKPRPTVLLVALVALVTVLLSPVASAQTQSDFEVRDQLIANQENLLNTYRCLFGVSTGAVPGGCPTPHWIAPDPAPANPTQSDIDVRDGLIQSQEALLNVYRCQFDVDTQLVSGGCGVSESPLATAVCPDNFDGAGMEFQYDPDDFQSDPALTAFGEAVEQHCGEWCGEWCDTTTETIVCPPGTVRSGESVTFENPGTLDEGDAIAIFCGGSDASEELDCRDPSTIGVLVANGTDVTGAAGRLSGELNAANYVTLPPRNASPQTGSAFYYRAGYEVDARCIARLLGESEKPLWPMPDPPPGGLTLESLGNAFVLILIGLDSLAQRPG